jgi:hypothetical protein
LTFYQITFLERQEGCQLLSLDLHQSTFLSTDEKIVTSKKRSTNLRFAI